MVELGRSYDAEELAKICGQEEDIRYDYYAFVGDKATVIAQDEGNGVVKVIEIIRQTPICPACGEPIDTIYTSRSVHLKYKDGKWSRNRMTTTSTTYVRNAKTNSALKSSTS